MSASKLCPYCRHPIKRNDEKMKCIGMCKKTYHVGCARLTPEEYSNFLTTNGAIKWICHSCHYALKEDVKVLTDDTSMSKSIDGLFKRNEGYEVYTATRYEVNEDGQKKSLENIIQMMDSSEVLISQYRKEVGRNNSNDREMIIKEVTNRREIRTKIVSPSAEFSDQEKHNKFLKDHNKKAIEPSEKVKNSKSRSLIFKRKNEEPKKTKLKCIQEKNTLKVLECESGESVLLHVKNTGNDEQYVECCQFIKPNANKSKKDNFPELLKILHNIDSDSAEKIKIEEKKNEKVLLSVSNDEDIKNNEVIKNTEQTLDKIKAIPDIPKVSSEKIGNDANNESLNTLFAQKNSLVVSTDHMDHKNTGQKRDRIKKQKPIKNKIPSNTLLIEDLIQNVSNVPTQSKKENVKPNITPAEFFINKLEENVSNHEQGSISTIIDLNLNESQRFDELCSRKCIEWKNIEKNSENVPLKSIIKVKEENEKIPLQRTIVCNKVTIKEVIGGLDSPQFQNDLLKTKSKTSTSQTKIKMKPTENLNKRKSKSKTPDKKESKTPDKRESKTPDKTETKPTESLKLDKGKEEKPLLNKIEGPIRTIIINKYEKRAPYEPSYMEMIKQMFGMGGIKQFDEETEIDDDIKPSAANASSQYAYKIPCSSTAMNTTVKMCPHYERDTQFPEDDVIGEDEETKQARELLKGLNKGQVEKIRNGELIRISSRKSSRKGSPRPQKSRKTSPKETKS